MKRNIIIFIFMAALLESSALWAQLSSTFLSFSGNHSTGYGRDFWFAIPQNYVANKIADKFYHVYVTSEKNTTVNFQQNGNTIIKKFLQKDSTIDFSAYSIYPLSGDFLVAAEMNSSGYVETAKAIHVWADNADLSVYLLSSVPYSTDGMYVLPTIGWGTEYVIGAYQDLYFPSGGADADWPSEFAIVANQDNTHVTITPSWDLRLDGTPSPSSTTTGHKRGSPFNVILNKGECIQYQAIQDLNDPLCDVTGSHIQSDKPIGVMGASAAPYLPGPWDNDCCGDFVLDMMQPTRAWSKSYFTCPFAKRKYAGDTYLMVASHDNQKIYRNGIQVAVIDKKWGFFYINDIQDASIWTSDSAFMLVQYMEGQYHDINEPGNPNPLKYDPAGDPASVVINATDEFTKKIIFQTAVINQVRTQQNNFTNFVNVILPTSEEEKTTFDGANISGTGKPAGANFKRRVPIGSTGWEGIQFGWPENSGMGAHTIISDTLIGCYIYGEGHSESYAWSGHLGVHTINDLDTIPPVAKTTSSCFCGHVRLYDSGPKQSKLSSFGVDSVYNFIFIPDSSFVPGAGRDSSFYDMCVADSLLPAFLSINVYDLAGNKTTVTTTYNPQLIMFKPDLLNFGKVDSLSTVFLYDTIFNTGQTPFQFTPAGLHLLMNSGEFSVDSTGVDAAMPPGAGRRVKIKFTASNSAGIIDTLAYSSSCLKFFLTMSANNGNVVDFKVNDFNFGCIDSGTSIVSPLITVRDLSMIPVNIDSIWVDDPVHFAFIGTLPVILESGLDSLAFRYTATAKEYDTTIAHFRSAAIMRSAKLIGCGQIPASVRIEGYSSPLSKGSEEYLLLSAQLDEGNGLAILPPIPNPVTSGQNSVHFVFGLSSNSPLDLSIFDMLGHHVATVIHTDSHPSGIYETDFSLGANIVSGLYIYRLAGAGKVVSGKLIIAK